MKPLITALFTLAFFNLWAQQKNVTYFKDRFLNNETSEKKAKFKRVTTYGTDGILNVQIIDLSKECLIKEENYLNNKPVGIWIDNNEDCILVEKRDFSKLRYNPKKIDSLYNNTLEGEYKENYEQAKFGDNEDSIFKYLQSNLNYPAEPKDAGISGTVYVQFIVKHDGTLQMYSILKSADPFLDCTSWQLIEKMGKWKPAKKNGQAIDSYFVLPLKFVLK
jgi:protein TonB